MVALVYKWKSGTLNSSDMVTVKAEHFAETLTTAQNQLEKSSRPYHELTILELSKDGYKYLDGTSLHPSANGSIRYYQNLSPD